jgi:hypothetical protein
MAANDHSRIGVVRIDDTHDYHQIMQNIQNPDTWFQKARQQMSLEAQELASEIVRLEFLKSQGHDSYEEVVTTVHEKPIGPRLRDLHRRLDETGFGPISRLLSQKEAK